MPRQVFEKDKLTIVYDESNSKDKVKLKEKEHKGKDLKKLTQKEKAELFDLYVDVGIIAH